MPLVIGIHSDRLTESSTGSFLYMNGLFIGFALERPWMGGANIPDKSCILPGDYKAEKYYSVNNKCDVPLLQEVPGRVLVEFHIANHVNQLLGCIAGGLERMQDAVNYSRLAFNQIMANAQYAWATRDEVVFQIRRP